MVALSSQQLPASAQRKPPARPHLHPCWWFLATALAGLIHHPSLAEQVPLSKFDPSSLPSLPVVWAHDTNGTEPVRIGDQVFIVSPSGSAVTAVQAQTGAKLWTVAAPKGVTLGALQAHAPDLLLAQGYSADAAVLLRISLAGKVLWQQSLAQLDDVSIARFGSGLAIRDRAGCRQRILDAKTGQLQPEAQSLRGHHIERFGLHGGPMTSSCEVTASLLFWQPGLALATDYRGKHGLLAIDPRGNQKWALPGMAYRLLHQSPDAVVVFGYDAARHPQLLRLNPATGVVLWQRTRSGSCDDDHLSRHPQVYSSPEPGPPGAPPRQSVLLQDCAHAELIELPSGKSLWTRPTQGALAVLDQLGPMNLGDPDESDHEYMVTSGAGTVAVQWFSGTGTAAAACCGGARRTRADASSDGSDRTEQQPRPHLAAAPRRAAGVGLAHSLWQRLRPRRLSGGLAESAADDAGDAQTWGWARVCAAAGVAVCAGTRRREQWAVAYHQAEPEPACGRKA
jgi:outer membrane protein assembly factor BamB